MSKKRRTGSRIPTFDEAVEIHRRLSRGEYQHDIAAHFGLNQGRISEVKTGKRHPSALNMVQQEIVYE